MRTDLEIVQLPNPLPNWGGLMGANLIQTDPDFDSTIVRITDGSTNKFKSMQTADSAQAGIWNSDDTLLLCRATTGLSTLFQFNPKKMQAQKLNYTFDGGLFFSNRQPATLYQLKSGQLWMITFIRPNNMWTLSSRVMLFDFRKVLPFGFKINWTGSFALSQDDSTMCVGFSEGVQNTGFHVCCYKLTTGMFRMLDTTTGIVTGDIGTLGAIKLNSPDVAFPFTIHGCNVSPNARYAFITPKQNSVLVWDMPTLNLTDVNISGHCAKGYQHAYFGGPGGGQYLEVGYADPANQRRMVVPKDQLPAAKGQKYDGDQHSGIGQMHSDDSLSMFWDSSASQTYPFTAAWMNEIRGYEISTGIVHRACHNFNTCKSVEFIVANAMAVASQTGKFVAFTSDAMGTLGGTDGSADGVIGTNARGDVFVVKVG